MLGIARAVAFIWLRPCRGKMWELATSVDNVRVGLVQCCYPLMKSSSDLLLRHLVPRLPGLVMYVA
jgi:hypothetical protein